MHAGTDLSLLDPSERFVLKGTSAIVQQRALFITQAVLSVSKHVFMF